MSVSNRDRLHQIKRWLDDEFPLGAVRLRVQKKMPRGYEGCLGVFFWESPRIVIKANLPISQAIDTLLHEWAHGRVGYPWRGERASCTLDSTEHSERFWGEMGRISNRYADGGQIESEDY